VLVRPADSSLPALQLGGPKLRRHAVQVDAGPKLQAVILRIASRILPSEIQNGNDRCCALLEGNISWAHRDLIHILNFGPLFII
jgi:hypothetical protein